MDRYQFIVRILEPAIVGVILFATVTCALKRKRWFTILGAGATVLALWVVLSAWNTKGGLEDLGLLIVFGYVVLPLAAAMTIAAIRLGKPESWWWQHVHSENGRERANARYARGDTPPRPPGPRRTAPGTQDGRTPDSSANRSPASQLHD